MKINDEYIVNELTATFDLLVDGFNENNGILRNQRLRAGLERFRVILHLLVNAYKD